MNKYYYHLAGLFVVLISFSISCSKGANEASNGLEVIGPVQGTDYFESGGHWGGKRSEEVKTSCSRTARTIDISIRLFIDADSITGGISILRFGARL